MTLDALFNFKESPVLTFIRNHGSVFLSTLLLTTSIPTSSHALLDETGRVISGGKEVYGCDYKGHWMIVHCSYDQQKRYRCFPYDIRDSKGKQVSIESLNPKGCLIKLDPNTGLCHDLENSCNSTYPCC